MIFVLFFFFVQPSFLVAASGQAPRFASAMRSALGAGVKRRGGHDVESYVRGGYLPGSSHRSPQVVIPHDSLGSLGSSQLSWQEYYPESYSKLSSFQKKCYTQSFYDGFLKQFCQSKKKGIVFKRISYPVDGQPVSGYAVLPRTFGVESGGCLVHLRGGLNGTGPFEGWGKVDFVLIMNELLYFAQHGYTVFAPQYRGIEGNTNKDQFGGKDVNDVVALIDEIGKIEDCGMAIFEGVSFRAFSRGAFMLLKVLEILRSKKTYPISKLRSIIIKSGVSNMLLYREFPEFERYIIPLLEQSWDGYFEASEEVQTRRLRDLSLSYKTHLLEGIPTRIAHAKGDKITPSDLARDLEWRLKLKGVPCEASFYDDDSHQIGARNQEELYDDLVWMNKYHFHG